MSLRLHCLVCIVLLMLILHMCFILLHNSPLRVPLVLHSSLSAINFAIPIFFFIMFAWYLCPSLHFQLLCFIPLNFCFRQLPPRKCTADLFIFLAQSVSLTFNGKIQSVHIQRNDQTTPCILFIWWLILLTISSFYLYLFLQVDQIDTTFPFSSC